MKNREKFREELAVALKESLLARYSGSDVCGFIKDKVWPSFLTKEEIAGSGCGNNIICDDCTCDDCTKAFVFWLDEEYEEPPKPEVDWNNVPVDTLVRVRDYQSDEWTLRYFKGFSRAPSAYPPGYDYYVWALGATSVTAEGDTEQWKYCELVEDEDDGSN